MYEEAEAREAYLEQGRQEGRKAAIEQCAGVLLGERGRLLKLQGKQFSGNRDGQIAKLYSMAQRLRKLAK